MIETLLDRLKQETRWKEKCILIELIHLSMLHKNKKWKVRETSILVGFSIGATSENLKLAKEMGKLINCKSRNKALKLLRDK